MAPVVKNPPANAGGLRAQSLGWEDSLEKEMPTHPSIIAWRIPWAEEPAGLQSMELQVGLHYHHAYNYTNIYIPVYLAL